MEWKFVYSSLDHISSIFMKRLLHNFYLAKLYRFNKTLFTLVTGFFFLTFLVNVLKAQATPFFIWGMFSERASITNQYKVVRVVVNDTVLIDYTGNYRYPSRFFLSAPVNAYVEMNLNNHLDKAMEGYPEKLKERFLAFRTIVQKTINRPSDYREFLQWYSRYIYQVTGNKVRSLTIEMAYCHYDFSNNLKEDSSKVINKSFY